MNTLNARIERYRSTRTRQRLQDEQRSHLRSRHQAERAIDAACAKGMR